MTELHYLQGDELVRFQRGLAALEGDIWYPVGDGEDEFAIDHGDHYQKFFTEMGEAHFLIGVDGDEVVASLAGVFRSALLGEKEIPTVYLGDLKIADSHRGGNITRRMATTCLKLLWKPRMRRFKIAFGVGMRGEHGDASRSLRGAHPGKLLRPLAELALYFVRPEELVGLGIGPAAPVGTGLDLSGNREPPPLFVSTAGRKDLRLRSTGQHWPLVHIPRSPNHWEQGLGQMLSRAGSEMPAESLACFCLDRGLEEPIRWLADNGIVSTTTGTVYALVLPGTLLRKRAWVHLATSEI